MIGPIAAWAAPVDPVAANEDSAAKEQAQELHRVTVTATRTARPRFTTPAAVSTLDREQIEQTLPYGYQDLFKQIPGVVMVGGPRRIAEEPAIRGFQDEQVVIRNGGARQNFNQAHRGRFFLDPSLLKRIEVLRGSSSAVYGSGALGGVISLETVDAADFLGSENGVGGRVRADYASNGAETGLYGTVYGQSGKFDVLASVAWRELDEDLQDGDGASIAATRDEIRNGLLKFGLDLSAQQRLEFSFTRFDNQGRNPPNANTAASATNMVDRDTRYDSYRINYDLAPTNRDWLDLHAVVYRNDVGVDEFRLDDDRRDRTDFRTDGLDVYNTSRFAFIGSRDASLTYGFEHYTDTQSGLRNGVQRPEFPDAEARYAAFYLQAQLPLTERLELVPSVRRDSFNYVSDGVFADRDEARVTPRLSLGFKATDDVYLWAAWAEAFRAPNLTELYASGVHFVAPIGPGQLVINEFVSTPNLRPEQARSVEAGLRWRTQVDGFSSILSATAFQSSVEDYVEQYVIFIAGAPHYDPASDTLIFPGITSNRNVDASLQGAELSYEWWADDWSGSVIGTLINGENDDSGVGLASLAQSNVVLAVSRALADESMRIGAQFTWAADRDDLPEGALPADSWHTFDVYSSWQPHDGWLQGFELRAGIDNLLDANYRVHPNGVNAAGRTIKISIAHAFGGL